MGSRVNRKSLLCITLIVHLFVSTDLFFDLFVDLSGYLKLDIVIENHKYLTLGYALFTEEKQLNPLIYI